MIFLLIFLFNNYYCGENPPSRRFPGSSPGRQGEEIRPARVAESPCRSKERKSGVRSIANVLHATVDRSLKSINTDTSLGLNTIYSRDDNVKSNSNKKPKNSSTLRGHFLSPSRLQGRCFARGRISRPDSLTTLYTEGALYLYPPEQSGAERSGRSGAERSGEERSGGSGAEEERSGAEQSGERSGAERSGAGGAEPKTVTLSPHCDTKCPLFRRRRERPQGIPTTKRKKGNPWIEQKV